MSSDKLEFSGELVREFPYGENPQQHGAALYDSGSDDPLAISQFEHLAGADPSSNNTNDIDRALLTLTHISAVMQRNGYRGDNGVHIALGVKHGNACGAGVSTHQGTALEKMLEGSLEDIHGGTVMTNFDIGTAGARTLALHEHDTNKTPKRLLDVLIAPTVTSEAIARLERKGGKLRFFGNAALTDATLDSSPRFRYVRGGFTVQDNYTFVPVMDDLEVKTPDTPPKQNQLQDLALAWAVGATTNSNTISIVRDLQLLGNGAGQQSRVGAARLAVSRAKEAGHDIEGAVAYSDSFFPFPDGIEYLAEQGIKAIMTSSGSVNDDMVFGAIKKNDIAVVTVPDRDGRGFFGH